MAELREGQRAGKASLRRSVVERLSSMSIARLGRVFVGAGAATCVQAFIAIVAVGTLLPAHAAWPCTYGGQTVECSRPVKGVFAGEIFGPMGSRGQFQAATEVEALNLLKQIIVEDAPKLIAAYSNNGSLTQCGGGDGLPLSSFEMYRNPIGSSGSFEYMRRVQYSYAFGASVVWSGWSGCGIATNPVAGRRSGTAAFVRKDTCSPGSFWTDWNYAYVYDPEDVDYAVCYSCPAGKQWVSQRNACVLQVSVPSALSPPPPPADACVGNPIHPLRGVKRETVDLGVKMGALSLTFTYDSTPLIPKTPANLAGSDGTQLQNPDVLGRMWSANLFKRIATFSRSASASVNPGAAQVSRGNGITITMGQITSSGQYTAEANTADRLVSLADGSLRYYDSKANVQETYNSAGQLTGLSWVNGSSISLTYSDANTPVSIAPGASYVIQAIDNNARVVNFSYTARTAPMTGAQLSSITDPAGQIITLSYDPSGNLASIHWPDGKTKTFLYENNAYGALTGISDELNQRYATFGYDTSWRAISSEHAGGVSRYSTSYTTPPGILIAEQYNSAADAVVKSYNWSLPQGTTVTGPNGQTSSWSASSLLNKNYLTSQSQPAGSGCAASSSALSYDANGNVASSDDFNGSRTCSAYDLSRNLETTRVEGLSNTQACSAVTPTGSTLPASSRKVSTTWHPDWRLEAKRAEPGKLTTSIYNGQPDPFNGNAIANCAPSTALLPDGKPIAVLCKQVEQATTDADGSQGFGASLQGAVANRTRSWTYNSAGQVLTETDPVNNTTSYAYYSDTTTDHTLGDLQSVTNAKNQATSYTKYNKHGQLLESTDPNGVVTTNTYDLRQRLLSTSVGGQTTSYEYDAAGQLLKVKSPDTSWIGYEYDAAHRQVAVKDNQGNRIEYVLDNAGNKTSQSVKDPGGNLARTLARSIDALGRVQQTTGRQ